jgi:hypothetical protein
MSGERTGVRRKEQGDRQIDTPYQRDRRGGGLDVTFALVFVLVAIRTEWERPQAVLAGADEGL